jgi:PIN domain nuclease of toxin-antitoxin system
MAKRVLLDTHVVIDLGTPDGLGTIPPKVRRILDDPEMDLLLSVVSEAEIAIKSQLGKLELTAGDLARVCAGAAITPYPLRRLHTNRLFDLPFHHEDPFDRLIISTALSDGLPLISHDAQFRKYRGLRVIW